MEKWRTTKKQGPAVTDERVGRDRMCVFVRGSNKGYINCMTKKRSWSEDEDHLFNTEIF